MPPRRRLGHNAPPDDDNPQSNLPPSFPARFMTVLELYRAQRDTPSQVQAAPPSPTFRVQYQPDAPPVFHTLFAILSSQATVVTQEELDTIREAVPSPPETPSPETILEAVERVLPASQTRSRICLSRPWNKFLTKARTRAPRTERCSPGSLGSTPHSSPS
jgi:hypothetical protein